MLKKQRGVQFLLCLTLAKIFNEKRNQRPSDWEAQTVSSFYLQSLPGIKASLSSPGCLEGIKIMKDRDCGLTSYRTGRNIGPFQTKKRQKHGETLPKTFFHMQRIVHVIFFETTFETARAKGNHSTQTT